MKKRLLLVAGIILIIVLGGIIWKDTQEKNRETNLLHDLQHILTFAEQKGADYATDELLYLVTYSYKKDSLHKEWEEPSESVETANEDIWKLSDSFQLVIGYDRNEQVEKVMVVPST